MKSSTGPAIFIKILIYKFLRLFNIDIAAGACINLLFFARIMGVATDFIVLLLLFNSVWIIYTIDRIIDVRRHKNLSTSRHKTHKKYLKQLLVFVAILASVNLYFLDSLSWAVLDWGLVLGGLVLLYLTFIWLNLKLPKEVIIAVIYTAGVALVPLSMTSTMSTQIILILVQHFLLAFYNLIIISYYEREQDKDSNQFNIANLLGQRFPILGFLIIITIVILSIINLNLGGLWQVQIVVLLMLSLLILVHQLKEFFSIDERYGTWVDAAFYLPALLLLLT